MADATEDGAKFDCTKPVQAENGASARIICTNRRGKHPVVALLNQEGTEVLACYSTDGKKKGEPQSGWDLVNVPPTYEVWLNIYKTGEVALHDTAKGANESAKEGRIALKRVRYRPGDADDKDQTALSLGEWQDEVSGYHKLKPGR